MNTNEFNAEDLLRVLPIKEGETEKYIVVFGNGLMDGPFDNQDDATTKMNERILRNDFDTIFRVCGIMLAGFIKNQEKKGEDKNE